MPDSRTAADVLSVLVLCGLMGMVGQGARTIVGLKKLSDSSATAPTQADAFEASRIVVGLMIGFVAGVIAGLSLKVLDQKSFEPSLLLGLAAAGYAGSDFIEGFLTTVAGKSLGTWKFSNGQPDAANVAGRATPPAAPAVKPEGPLFGLKRELDEAQTYKKYIEGCAANLQLPVELIYAIGSRESAWGLTLKPKGPAGTGDWVSRRGQMPPDGLGWGRGLMQADYAASEFAKGPTWGDPQANIEFCSKELADNIEFYRKAAYQDVDPVRAGVAAYNCGRGNVHKAITDAQDVDQYTAGHDYSRDVLKRAEWFKANMPKIAGA